MRKKYFEGLTQTNTDIEFYLPAPIMDYTISALEDINIPFTYYNARQVADREIPHPEITDKELMEKMQEFKKCGYNGIDFVFAMALIITPVSKSDLFEKCKLFYGPTIDPVFAKYDADTTEDGTEAAEIEEKSEKAWQKFLQDIPDNPYQN